MPWISLSTNPQNGWFFLTLDHTFIQPLLLAKTRNFFLDFLNFQTLGKMGKRGGRILNNSLL